MKKTLNEEVARIKSIMGCCKGRINEDDSQAMVMLQQATEEFNEKVEEDLTPDEFQEVVCSSPDKVELPENTTEEQKQKVEEFKAKLKTASIAELKQAKRQLKQLKQQQNEQAVAGSMVTLLGVSLPTGFAIAIGAILFIMILNILLKLTGIHLVQTIIDTCRGQRRVRYGIGF